MKNISQVLLGCVLILLSASNWATAIPLIDQQQPAIDISVGGLSIGGASQEKLAQVVTAGATGVLTEVRFPVACSSGDLVVEIQGVTGGKPNGVVLASQTIPGAGLPSFYPTPGVVSFRGFVLTTPVPITTGSQYAVVLSSAGECGIFQGPVGDTYQGGKAFFDARPNAAGVWVCVCDFAGARFDLPFQTLVAQPYPHVSVTDSLAPADDRLIPFNLLTPPAASDQNVTLTNSGYADLAMANIAGSNPLAMPFGITADGCSGKTLAPAGSCTLTVRFAPSVPGTFTDSFDIPSSDPDTPVVTMSVTGVATPFPVPDIAVTDSVPPINDLRILFGSITKGMTSPAQTLFIANAGNAALAISDIRMTGADASRFSLNPGGGTKPCGSSSPAIAAGGYCTVTLNFSPQSAGEESAALVIVSNDPDEGAVSVALSGTGLSSPADNAPRVILSGFGTATRDGVMSPGEWGGAGFVNFPATMPSNDGGGTTPATLFVMNDGANLYLALKIARTSFGGATNPIFEFDNNNNGVREDGDDVFGMSVGVNSPVMFIDDYRYTCPGAPAGSAGCGPGDTDSLSGFPPPGTADGSSAAKNDGTFAVIELSHPLNSGDSLHDFSLRPGDAVGFTLFLRLFSIAAQCNSGTDCYADTIFPSADLSGSLFGEIVISLPSGTSAGPAVPVPFIAVTDSVLPIDDLQIAFGKITVGTTSPAQSIIIANIGAEALTVTNIQLTGADASQFGLNLGGGGRPCGSATPTVPAGGNCTATLTLSPQTPGAKRATLEIASNDPHKGTVSVALSGIGHPATANNNPSAPLLVYPVNGKTVAGTMVACRWKKSADPDGNAVSYHLYYCTNPSFTGCSPDTVAATGIKGAAFAGFGFAGIVFIGVIFAGGAANQTGWRGRKERKVKIASLVFIVILAAGTILISCGTSGIGGVSPSPPVTDEVSYGMSDLISGTTYYWKVVADDGKGGTAESAVWSFTTQ